MKVCMHILHLKIQIVYSVLHAENEKVYYARPSELLYGELLPRYIASVLSVYKQAKQSDP